ncbi:MAG: hypothetical protein KatS3mg010_0348 [Acidimicrobiia bacterium]|nr:MAG: hypothetical protein KatS3mg010_0348 [Acidimicrobiia bacterium]
MIVCENGSTDGTLGLARELARKYDELRVEHLPDADYGRALRAGLLTARGDAVVNFDTDYYDLDFLGAAVERVLSPGGPAIVVGSKRGAGANDTRPLLRRLVTATFGTVLRVVFGLRVSDTHGVKAMHRETVQPFARRCRFGKDLFDTELVLRVERAGHRTEEIPVDVVERRPARTSILRRVPRTLLGLVQLRVALWRDRV